MRIYTKASLALTMILLVALNAACAALPGPDEESLTASGIVEVTEVSISPELSGRVITVAVRAGDRVQRGDELFKLEGEMTAAQLQTAQAALEAAKAQLNTAQAGLRAAETSLDTAEINAEIAQLQYEWQHAAALQSSAPDRALEWTQTSPERIEQPGWYFSPSQEIEALEAAVGAAQQRLQEAQSEVEQLIHEIGGDELSELERELMEAQTTFLIAQELYFQPVGTDEADLMREELRDQYERARDALDDVQDELDRLLEDDEREDLRAARANLSIHYHAYLLSSLRYYEALTGENALGVQIAQKQSEQAELAVEQAEAGREQAAAQVDQARKAVAQAEVNLTLVELQQEKLIIRAPVSGTVLTSSLDAGEVVQAGGPLMTIGVLDEMHITVYLPENQYGRVSIGDRAEVEVDSFPEEVFSAEVVRIADEAEFTPRNVQTEEERQTTVYAVELRVIRGEEKLKPGMPADVIFVGEGVSG